MAYSGARGTLIYEQNLKSKISRQTRFKCLKLFRDGVRYLGDIYLLLPAVFLLQLFYILRHVKCKL
jgi:hypothetical protein